MTTKIVKLILLIIICSSTSMLAQEKVAIEISDIQNLLGSWTGSLTYIDYNSNNPYSMPCALAIKSTRKNRKLSLAYTYPKEPEANSRAKLKISKNRFKINGKKIIARSTLSDGTTQIITSYSSKDGNDRKKAVIRNSYIIGSETLIIRKEVQFEGTEAWFKRNEYNFKRG